MKTGFSLVIIVLASAVAFAAVGLLNPNVHGQPDGNTYQVSFTQSPMDPMVKDFHLFWDPPPGVGTPLQARWQSQMPAGWVVNTGTAPNPNGTGNVSYVSYTIPGGVYTASWEPPQTFTFGRDCQRRRESPSFLSVSTSLTRLLPESI